MTSLTSMCELACQIVQKNLEEKQLEEEQAAKTQNWKLPICYDDDDDEESSNSLEDNITFELPSYSAVTPSEPVDSLNMGDEHLNTILAMESEKFIKSCVENLVPNPSESEGENQCDVPAGFTTFSNVLFNVDYDFDSSDDQSPSDEDVPEKIYSNPLFDEEIIPMEIDQHSFNAEFDLIESMPNHDSSIIISSTIDSLFDEFAGELTLLKSIPPGINETDCHHEKETRFAKRFLHISMPERHVSPTPHDAMLTRWRSRVASRSSSPTTFTPEIPTAPILPVPSAFDRPIGRLYRTYPGGTCRALTVRKSVRPLPSHRLALRYTSYHLDRFTSESSSGHSSLDRSSSGHSISGHSLSRPTPPDITISDSFATLKFVYPPLARTLWYSKAYRRWRSIVATVTSSIHALRALVPSRVDLLPSRKRFRDSISLEDSVEEDIDTDVLANIKANATVIEVAVDKYVEAGVDVGIGMKVDVRVDVKDEVKDEVESSDRGTMEVEVFVVAEIDIPDGMLMPDVVEHLE
uniref:Uncharacterized protein n=1 Tax=Tanacetum cinerariifolium TaxID=118510 RepID=A0A6L2LUI1_TANCI|nr:hypothetical protein [Tanacetum cinerariifolium]